MADNLKLTYGGKTLSDTQVRYIVKRVVDKLNCAPSFPIVCFYSESNWGTSTVGSTCNNWAGMSYMGSKQTIKRDSGITAYKCLSRPSNEGFAYFGYDTFADFLTDWIYLFRRQGNYRVYGKKVFADCVKGMFKYGGANYDYAVYGNNSKTNYDNYYALMKGVRDGINSSNNNLLTKLDNGTIDWGDDPPNWEQDYPDDDIRDNNILDIFKNLFNEANKELNTISKEMLEALLGAMNSNAFDFSKKSFGNKNIHITKLLDNMYLMRTTGNINKIIEELEKRKNNLNSEVTEKKDDTSDNDNGTGGGSGSRPAWPTIPRPKSYITSSYGYRGDIGVSGATRYHYAIDIGGVGVGSPVYASQVGEVYFCGWWSNATGYRIVIKHTHSKDKYYTGYQHLKEKPNFSVGDTVTKGQQIALTGGTGIGVPHLHYDVSKNGTFFTAESTIDPEKYLKMRF